MQFNDLSRQAHIVSERVNHRIRKIISAQNFILGSEVAEFEEQLKNFVNVGHCISVANGTDALKIALMALGIGPYDEVIVPAFGYISAASAVKLVGATPIYVDVEYSSCNIDPSLIEQKITKKTKAIIAISLFGQCANFEKLNEICVRNGLFLIEDAAQSIGSTASGVSSGSFGHVSCTSFFPSKPLGCYGDGGAVLTNESELADKVRKIARHGQSMKYEHDVLGFNSRLDTIQAAVLIEKLAIFDQEVAQRKNVASLYNKLFSSCPNISTPGGRYIDESVWAQYTIKVNDRKKIIENLNKWNIPHAIYYPKPLYQQIATLDSSALAPVSENLCKVSLSLPFNPYMAKEEVSHIVDIVLEAAS